MLSAAEANSASYLEVIEQLVERELQGRERKRLQTNLRQAGFPAIKRLEEFDYRHQTTITKRQVNQWLDFRFLEERTNLIFIGPPGVGKTHLAIGLGLKALDAGYKVLFTTALTLVETLELAEMKGELKKKIAALGVTELACLAHARRKFFELQAAGHHPLAAEALRRLGELYAIEAQARDLDIKARLALRQGEAKPRLLALHDWLGVTRLSAADGSGLARAIDYTLKRWPAILRYADSGHLPIDNNSVENAIRPIALGRRNWLFAGSAHAGQRAAAIQSLLATAKLNGLEPYAWLKETLKKLPAWPNSRIDELLPLRVTTQAPPTELG